MAVAELVGRIRAGERRAIAALMRELDDERPEARAALQALRAAVAGEGDRASNGAAVIASGGLGLGHAVTVGITGGPGAGKSTLVDALIGHWRAQGRRVGVVAVDPSSTVGRGGAVLGDRVRMQRHATDDGVFIRSLASRGASGGLSRSTIDVADVLVAAGFTELVIETVGVGQGEVDVAGAADVTVVVMTPGLGDDVQALKAGILEIADVLVLNKADRPGADATLRDLQAMLSLRAVTAARPSGAVVGTDERSQELPPEVPIVSTVATTGQGVVELANVVDRLRLTARTGAHKADEARRLRRAEARIRSLFAARMDAEARAALAPGGAGASLVDDVASLRLDAEAAAEVLMERLRGGY